MVVDDSSAVRQRIFASLKVHPRVEAICQATTGEEALALMAEFKPDLITLDMMLPGMNGLEVLAEVKRLDPAPVVVMLTNYPYPAFRKGCMDLGAEYFLGKSSVLERILGIVQEVAERLDGGPKSEGSIQ